MVSRAGWDGVSQYAGTAEAPAHAVSVLVIEGAGINHQLLHEIVVERLPQLALFRCRLVAKPLGMGVPVWAEVGNYDPTPQTHSTALSGSKDGAEFTAMIAVLATGALNPRAPLWEAWSIEGLEGGRWALAIRMSPALTGGSVAGVTRVWEWLTHASQYGHPTQVTAAEQGIGAEPSISELIADTALELLENSLQTAWRLAGMVPVTVRQLRRQLYGAGRPTPIGEPRWIGESQTPAAFASTPTPRREIALASIRMAQLKFVARAFGACTDTVALTACTLGLRTWLRRNDSLTDHPLIMRVSQPLASSPRIFTDPEARARRIGLPVHIDDPVQTLLFLHESTQDSAEPFPDTAAAREELSRLIALLPPSVQHLGETILNRLPWRPLSTSSYLGTITYMPELSAKSAIAGRAKIVGAHTVAPLIDDSRLSIALSPHDDLMNLCICVCPDQARADDIASAITESADILVAAAQQHPRGQGPSVVTRIGSRTPRS